MPRHKSIARELNCLSTTGGRAHWKRKDENHWTFDSLPVQSQISFVTPSQQSNNCTNDNLVDDKVVVGTDDVDSNEPSYDESSNESCDNSSVDTMMVPVMVALLIICHHVVVTVLLT